MNPIVQKNDFMTDENKKRKSYEFLSDKVHTKTKKLNAINLGNFYGVHFNTIHNWKKKKTVLYKAMVDYFMKSGDTKYES